MMLVHKNWRFAIASPREWFRFRWKEVISGGGWIEDTIVWQVGPFVAAMEVY